jgi:hypothetical protein
MSSETVELTAGQPGTQSRAASAEPAAKPSEEAGAAEAVSFQKTEMTVEGILGFFEKYARTYWLLLWPFRAVRLIVVEDRGRARRVPPLMFLSISSFLFAFVVDSFVSSEGTLVDSPPGQVFKLLSQKISPETSITGVVFSSLPIIIFVVGVSYLVSRIWLAGEPKRKRFFDFFCYTFGSFAASIFLLFLLANFAILLDERKQSASGQTSVTANVIIIVCFLAFTYVIFQPFVALGYGLWKLDADRSRRRRWFKILCLLLLYPPMLFASGWTETLPHKFNSAISPPTPRPEIYTLSSGDSLNKMPVEILDLGENVELRFDVALQNPTNEQIFFTRKGGQFSWHEWNKPSADGGHSVELRIIKWPEQEAPALLVATNEVKWVQCSALMPKSVYEQTKQTLYEFKITMPYQMLRRGRETGEAESESVFLADAAPQPPAGTGKIGALTDAAQESNQDNATQTSAPTAQPTRTPKR